ncbi:MAG: hypothetical protein GY811_05805 [Myxococcales bacterium]|nr:hypothetical protein [Myxococcales bacterium]
MSFAKEIREPTIDTGSVQSLPSARQPTLRWPHNLQSNSQGGHVPGLQKLIPYLALSTLAFGACDLGKIAVGTTSKVLDRGKYASKQEPDYDFAAAALPASLKTVESFHMTDPSNQRLTNILAEGFCQYTSGFIEDEWEVAVFAKDFEAAEYLSNRASKNFMRCMGYGLHILGKKWQKAILGSVKDVEKRLARTGFGKRDALLWTGVGLAGSINHNKGNPAMLAQVEKAKAIIERVIVLDTKHKQKDKAKAGFAHIVRAMLYLALPKLYGGDPEAGKAEFDTAIQITENKFLLAKVLVARKYAVATQDKELFRKTLIEVLRTDPAIWPAQRLANEIAHRRAKRYLKHEKEFF